MISITVPDLNDSMSSISLDGKDYNIRFTYNELFDSWSFGIYDDGRKPIVTMTRIVPNFPFMIYMVNEKLPNGQFGCLSKSGVISRNSFIDGDAEFVYFPNSESIVEVGD